MAVRQGGVSSLEEAPPLVARNVAVQYVAIAVEVALGFLLLPFNLAHLGAAAYGLWVLTASVTTYLSMLDLGYGAAQVKFTAQYRALGDAGALNQIASTLFFLFAGLAAALYGASIVAAFNIGHLFALDPAQAGVARQVLLIVSLHVALSLPFSVFGGITNGFQLYYRNSLISIGVSLAVATATVAVLGLGYGLVELVTVTTAIRIAGLTAYRQTAYRALPGLAIRWRHVRRARLREVTAFSAYLLVIDIASKISITADTMVIGAFMGTAAIAVWAVGARLVSAVQTVSHVPARFLFPAIVDRATRRDSERLQALLVHGTRVSLALAIPMSLTLALVADDVVAAWVGPRFAESVPIVRLLAAVAAVRIGTHTAYSLLKGAGEHRFAGAWSVITALANLGLSLVLVQRLGLVGVAVGTLIPVTVVALCVQFPAACRRAGLPLRAALARAVWPALWPAGPAAAVVVLTRGLLPAGLPASAAAAAAGALCYAALFGACALHAGERQAYVQALTAAVSRRRDAVAVGG